MSWAVRFAPLKAFYPKYYSPTTSVRSYGIPLDITEPHKLCIALSPFFAPPSRRTISSKWRSSVAKDYFVSDCRSLSLRISSTTHNQANSGSPGTSNPSKCLPSDNQQPPQIEPSIFTIPTILTLARVVAVPILVAVYYGSPDATTAIFILASFTDWLDGYLARKMRTISSFGAFLDPVADKLMVAAALILLCTEAIPCLSYLPAWTLPAPAIAIVGREIAMSAIREWAASQGGDLHKAVAVSWVGKWKTATQMVAISLLLFSRQNFVEASANEMIVGAGLLTLYLSAALSLLSLSQYMRAIWVPLMKAS